MQNKQEWLEKVRQTVEEHPEYLDENLELADKVRREAAFNANKFSKLGMGDLSKQQTEHALDMHDAYEVLKSVKKSGK